MCDILERVVGIMWMISCWMGGRVYTARTERGHEPLALINEQKREFILAMFTKRLFLEQSLTAQAGG